ncbi:hypothetical protein [Streptomyces sp. H27-D2]|uniref:hypothetical protein n=1 Tax=Streptomyces sp. H27-D2 TaxID=3046304 RepID=UPI002DBF2905|nr:hypothetical protein [Streptomyces sp. H27-D2]MEC4015940.1 hypothetical protein [Streptomyces sp. H27-D2]
MSLEELLGRADERGLAISAVACLDRCLPPTAGGAGNEAAAEGADRAADRGADRDADALEEAPLRALRAVLGAGPLDPDPDLDTVALVAVARALPDLRAWAVACSTAALDLHRLLDGDNPDITPLADCELRRQLRILAALETLDASSGGALRTVLDLSNEGKRVLGAAVSRRERGRAAQETV